MSTYYRWSKHRSCPSFDRLEERVLLFKNVLNGNPIHEGITEDALSFLKTDILNEINSEHKIQDTLGALDSTNHFDNSEFSGSAANINSHYNAIINDANPSDFKSKDIADEFGKLLHTAQDFYAHSNWVNLDMATLIDSGTGLWDALNPYSIHDGAMVVQGENEHPIVAGYGKATLSRNGFVVTVSFPNGKTFKGLISGSFGLTDDTPDNVAVPHNGSTTVGLNKDDSTRDLFVEAFILADQQTKHEFVRLATLIKDKYGQAGINNLLCQWVRPEKLAYVSSLVGGGSGVTVVPVIDHSGSMGDNGKLEAAQQAADTFVSLLNQNDQVGVVQFDDTAQVIYPLSTITPGSTVQSSAEQAIDALQPGGATSIGAGVLAAYGLINQAQSPARAMIVLTDGIENTKPHALDVIQANEAKACTQIFTIGFGSDADTSLLQQMASLGDGQFYFAASNADLQDIYVRIAGAISGQQDVMRRSNSIQAGQQQAQNFQVDASTSQLTVGLEWPGSDLDLSLVTPDGTIITRDSTDTNVQFIGGATSEFFKIQSPQPGAWKAVINGVTVAAAGENYDVFARVNALVAADLSTEKQAYKVGDQVNLQLILDDATPIKNATVDATILSPGGLGGGTKSVTFFDDGNHNDNFAGDGIYGAAFPAGVFGAGSYVIQAHVAGTDNSGNAFVRTPSQTIIVTGSGQAQDNLPPMLSAIDNQNVNEGDSINFAVVAAEFDQGQTLTYSLDFGAPLGAAIDPKTGVFNFTPADGPATYTVTARVTDNGTPALSDTKTFTIKVANVAPTVNGGSDAQLVAGHTLSHKGSFTDPGVADSFTATVNYGDGSGDQALALNADRTFALVHTYANAGTFTATVTVKDKDGGKGLEHFTVLVASPTTVTPQITDALDRSRVALVSTLYRDLLNRFPEAQGLGFWKAHLASGTKARRIAFEIGNSREHRYLQRHHLAPRIGVGTALRHALQNAAAASAVHINVAHPVGVRYRHLPTQLHG